MACVPPNTSLRSFLSRVHERMIRSARNPRFPEHQASLLTATVELYFRAASSDDWAHPLGLFHATYRMFADRVDEKGLLVAESCSFFLLSLDLFDDVQDDDLAGKHYATEGSAVATNSALALLFLAQDALRQAMELEEDAARRLCCLRVVNRISLLAISAQHQDLTSSTTHPSRDEVLEMHAGKTSAVQMVAECAALAAGAAFSVAEEVGLIGSRLAVLTQIVDDVRDVFGKTDSPDLRSNKATYLRAAFDEIASGDLQLEYARLRERLDDDGSYDAIRRLLAESGSLDVCAQAAHDARVEIHERIARLSASQPHRRVLLSIVDSLASLLYTPEPVPESDALFRATQHFSLQIEEQGELFRSRLDVGFPKELRFQPWHRPIFMYEPSARVIYYPDLDGVPEEILPAYAVIFGDDEAQVRGYLSRALPLFVAHELFHAFRDQVDRLGSDAWHEEYVADRLAVSYLRAFDPQAHSRALEACSAILEIPLPPPHELRVREVLTRAERPSLGSVDYETDLLETAHVHARVCLSADEEPLDVLRRRWLSYETALAAE